MYEVIEMMFEEICGSLGLDWYECEGEWGIIEKIMLDAGLDADEVAEFFSQLAWDL